MKVLAKKIKKTAYNTDGRGNKLVTVFAGFLHRRQICGVLVPGLPPLQVIELLHLDYFQASGQFIVANAAPVAAPQICKTGLLCISAPVCTATLN